MSPTEQEIAQVADEIAQKEQREKARRELKRRQAQTGMSENRKRSKRRDRERGVQFVKEREKELADAYGKEIARKIDARSGVTYQYLELKLSKPGRSEQHVGAVLVGKLGEDPYARMDRLERTLQDAQLAGFIVKRGSAQYGPSLLPKRVEQVVAVNPDLDELRRLSGQPLAPAVGVQDLDRRDPDGARRGGRDASDVGSMSSSARQTMRPGR